VDNCGAESGWLMRMDAHFTALRDHGRIKFWSILALRELLQEANFVDIRFDRDVARPLPSR
jgi:hypothetical protein